MVCSIPVGSIKIKSEMKLANGLTENEICLVSCSNVTLNLLALSELKLKLPISIRDAEWCKPSLNNSEGFGDLEANE